MADILKFPFAEADVQTASEGGATLDLTILSTLTIVNISGLTEALEVTTTPSPELMAGSKLIVKAAQGATGYDITFGSDFTGGDITGVANDTNISVFYYDGSGWIAEAAVFKLIDAA